MYIVCVCDARARARARACVCVCVCVCTVQFLLFHSIVYTMCCFSDTTSLMR